MEVGFDSQWRWCLGMLAKLQKAVDLSCLSVCLSWLNSFVHNGWIFMNFDIWGFLKNLLRKYKFHYNLSRITGTLHEHPCTFMILSCWILHRMRNILCKSCRENQNTHFMFNNLLFLKNCGVSEICKNIVEPYRPQMTI
jgi:hypothetical protein